MAAVNVASFQGEPVTAENGFQYEVGTVELTLRGETRRVSALRFSGTDISARGIYGKYQTSSKRWPASIMNRNGAEFVSFGRDDRSAKFNKLNSVWFE